jgi:ParB family transcriptional regulator, chromosome partitioning protein
MAAKKKKARRKKAEPDSRGLAPGETRAGDEPGALRELEARIASAKGEVIGRYRDPLGGHWLALAALPVSQVAPTPFQRDLSDAHAKRLTDVLERVGVFLDPLIAVAAPESAPVAFWTPNGNHRLTALKRLGAKTVIALVSPDPQLAYRILALNTEKAHNTKEKSLEAIRMARGLAEVDDSRHESDFALELEDGSLVTLGIAYEEKPRFGGGAYAAALKASDEFLEQPLRKTLALRGERAKTLLEIDERVGQIVKGLQERGFKSPYLRNFVVARIRPFRPPGKPAPDADALLEHMHKASQKFDVAKVKEGQVASAAGGGDEG